MFKLLLPFLLIIFSVSCQTIHYTKKSGASVHYYTYSQWHHVGILGFVEFSPPVNVKMTCEDKGWKAVRTQRNVLQGLMSLAISASSQFVYPALGLINFIYTPHEVSVACNNS